MKIERRIDSQPVGGIREIGLAGRFNEIPLLVQDHILSSCVVTDRRCALVCKQWKNISFNLLIKYFVAEADELINSVINCLPKKEQEQEILTAYEKIKNEFIEKKFETSSSIMKADMLLFAKIAYLARFLRLDAEIQEFESSIGASNYLQHVAKLCLFYRNGIDNTDDALKKIGYGNGELAIMEVVPYDKDTHRLYTNVLRLVRKDGDLIGALSLARKYGLRERMVSNITTEGVSNAKSAFKCAKTIACIVLAVGVLPYLFEKAVRGEGNAPVVFPFPFDCDHPEVIKQSLSVCEPEILQYQATTEGEHFTSITTSLVKFVGVLSILGMAAGLVKGIREEI